MKNLPNKIYLQVNPEDDPNLEYFNELGVTWCSSRINDTDIEYVISSEAVPTEVLGLDQPWPLKSVLEKLISATELLLNKKDYDGHDHEEIRLCANRAKDILASLPK